MLHFSLFLLLTRLALKGRLFAFSRPMGSEVVVVVGEGLES